MSLPVHVTLRLMPRLWGLRRPNLIVEAASNEWLARAMQGLSTRLAIALNRLRGEHGRVFADRYHAHVLRTPPEVRRAVAYVLDNHLKHARERGAQASGTDWFSSAVWPVVVAPKTWLLATAGRTSSGRASLRAQSPPAQAALL
jgi:hypothetical protein